MKWSAHRQRLQEDESKVRITQQFGSEDDEAVETLDEADCEVKEEGEC